MLEEPGLRPLKEKELKLETIIDLLRAGAFPVCGSPVARNYAEAELRAWDQGAQDALETIKRALADAT